MFGTGACVYLCHGSGGDHGSSDACVRSILSINRKRCYTLIPRTNTTASVCVGGGGEMREREMGLEDGRKKGCEGERERGEMGKRGEAGRRGEEGEEEKGGNGGRERG